MVCIGLHLLAWMVSSFEFPMELLIVGGFICLETSVVQFQLCCLSIIFIPYWLIRIIPLAICMLMWAILYCHNSSASLNAADVLNARDDFFEVTQPRLLVFEEFRGVIIVALINPSLLLFFILSWILLPLFLLNSIHLHRCIVVVVSKSLNGVQESEFNFQDGTQYDSVNSLVFVSTSTFKSSLWLVYTVLAFANSTNTSRRCPTFFKKRNNPYHMFGNSTAHWYMQTEFRPVCNLP